MVTGLNNKAEFKALYTEYFSILVNYAYSKTSDWELSREIVQQTFVKLWTRREQTQISSSLKSYLFMMIRNAIIDNFRQQKRFEEIGQFKERQFEESFHQNEEDLVIMRHIIKRVLENMKPKRRQIFEMSKFEGLTYSEIAQYLKISERSVEDNIAKALSELREVLKLYKKDL